MPVMVWAGVGVAAALVLWVAGAFNRFIRQANLLREAWSGIDVQLKRRHDLVPRLVECVKGYREHERTLFENIAQARSQAEAAQGVTATGAAETGLARQFRTVFAVAEAYPELKASQEFQTLSAALVETEDQLQFARRYYNGAVRDYNTLVESFPSRLVAAAFGFQSKVFFEVEAALERQAPEVKL